METEKRLGVDLHSVELERNRLRWTVHALRNSETVLKDVLLFRPNEGVRGKGRLRLRFYDTVKVTLLEFDVSTHHQPELSQALIEMTADQAACQKIVNWRR